MTTTHTFGKTFGPTGSFAGYALLAAAVYVLTFSMAGIFLLLLGAFMAFSFTGTRLNTSKKRVIYATFAFGFLPLGKRIKITRFMLLGVKRAHRGWRAYSRSNRTLDMHKTEYRIMLLSHTGDAILPLKAFETEEQARTEMKVLGDTLGISALKVQVSE